MAALAANTLVGGERLAPRLQKTRGAKRASFVTRAGKYDDELLETAVRKPLKTDACVLPGGAPFALPNARDLLPPFVFRFLNTQNV